MFPISLTFRKPSYQVLPAVAKVNEVLSPGVKCPSRPLVHVVVLVTWRSEWQERGRTTSLSCLILFVCKFVSVSVACVFSGEIRLCCVLRIVVVVVVIVVVFFIYLFIEFR